MGPVQRTINMMNFLARVVRFLFWLLVLSWGLRFLRRVVSSMLEEWPGSGAANRGFRWRHSGFFSGRAGWYAIPVCGMHVDEALSIPVAGRRRASALLLPCLAAMLTPSAPGNLRPTDRPILIKTGF